MMGFQPGRDSDLVQQFRDDDSWTVFRAVLSPAFAPDFESANAADHVEAMKAVGLAE